MSEQQETYTVRASNGQPVKVITADNPRLIRLRAYKKLIEALLSVCAAIYELTTGENAPYYRDVLRQ